MRSSRIVVFFAVMLAWAGAWSLVTAAWSQTRESGVQVTPDGKRVLISKDVGGQRWAITRNLNDGTVTGNVYLPEGGDPTFLFCRQRGATLESVELSCYGAGRCLGTPCGGVAFSFIAVVDLPQSFFLPPEAAAAATDGAARTLALAHTFGVERESGLQITPDELRTLISKDVGGQRWAITRNADDDTVTGNVYQEGSGDPVFLFCTQTEGAGETVSLSCSGAGRCEAAPCSPEQFTFIADVELARSFFTPPSGPAPTPSGSCGNGQIDSTAEDCDGADLGDLDCFYATQAFEDCTGTLACRSDCKFDFSACSCPCTGDFDCGVPINCSAFIPACELGGACEGGQCVMEQVGTREICEGVDPEDPEIPRSDQCELP